MRGYRPWEVSHLFSHEISRRMPSESCLGTPWGLSYEHVYKNIHFCKGKGKEGKQGKGREGKGKGKREGREGKGRKGREGKEKRRKGREVKGRKGREGHTNAH